MYMQNLDYILCFVIINLLSEQFTTLAGSVVLLIGALFLDTENVRHLLQSLASGFH